MLSSLLQIYDICSIKQAEIRNIFKMDSVFLLKQKKWVYFIVVKAELVELPSSSFRWGPRQTTSIVYDDLCNLLYWWKLLCMPIALHSFSH